MGKTQHGLLPSSGEGIQRGRFHLDRSRVTYALDFYPSDGEWKPIRLNVNVKPLIADKTLTAGKTLTADGM